MLKEDIIERLTKHFPNSQIEVVDTTMEGNHFSITIISDLFNGLSLIKRHKLIYDEFEKEITTTIHALQIKTFTKLEWKQNKI